MPLSTALSDMYAISIWMPSGYATTTIHIARSADWMSRLHVGTLDISTLDTTVDCLVRVATPHNVCMSGYRNSSSMNPSTFNQICWGTQSCIPRVFGRDTDLPYDILPQKDYRAAMKFEQQLPIRFRRNGLGFVLLRDAFIEELKGLEGGNKEAFARAAKRL
ncbi:hypothetical protein A0H81_04670 [Grifola frondosa]|uniref:Uncharacterized protein n=1 Tax=Grifola frondosa TaxID=5627 RepID=A0A1C7MH06_GRIFR|nr:hypothetical protein A0H81_04670 [Grifola frondosa]